MTNENEMNAGADQPLMSGNDVEPEANGTYTDAGSQEPLTFRNAGKIVQFLTLTAGLSGLLFGFDTGVISSTLVSIGSDLSHRPLSTWDMGFVTAITSILALVAAPFTGYFADKFGRLWVITIPANLFIIGAVVQAFASEVWVMVLGRALVGAAVGVASGASPLYITELAPAELRGRLVTIQSLFVTGGQVVAYLVGFAFADVWHGWRWMVGLGAIPAAVQLILLVWMPESPRWLLRKGREDQARSVLLRVYGNLDKFAATAKATYVFESMKAEILAEDKADSHEDDPQPSQGFRSATRELFKVPGNRRALTIACLLQGLQQLSGFNCLMYFSATIFAMVGFHSPIGTSLTIALTNFIFTLVAFTFIDVIGRRSILLRSIPFMVLGLGLCGIAFSSIKFVAHIDIDTLAVKNTDAISPILLVVSMIIYVAAYAVGLGCVPWQQSELFPLRVRSLGSGIATSVNWSSNAVIGITFLPMMRFLGPSLTFLIYALVCVVGWFLIFQIYPETAGLEIEDINLLLRDGWNVQNSIKDFRRRRAARFADVWTEPE